jgi:hypothetical protein
MKPAEVLKTFRYCDNPIFTGIGVLSGLGCIAIGFAKQDITMIGIGAFTTPTLAFIARSEAKDNFNSIYEPTPKLDVHQ